MRKSTARFRHRMMTALLQIACIAQAGFAAVALTGIAHGAHAADDSMGKIFEDLDRGCTICEHSRVEAPAGTPTAVAGDASNRLEPDGADPVDRLSPLPGASLVSADLLEQTRGGFELSDRGNTLRVTFGVERTVYVNGALVSTSTLALDGLGRLTDSGTIAQGAQARALGMTADLLRNGTGNVLSMNPTELPTGALLLQNTLNDQRLEARTMINAVVEGAQLMRAARLESIMRDSSIGAVRR